MAPRLKSLESMMNISRIRANYEVFVKRSLAYLVELPATVTFVVDQAPYPVGRAFLEYFRYHKVSWRRDSQVVTPEFWRVE